MEVENEVPGEGLIKRAERGIKLSKRVFLALIGNSFSHTIDALLNGPFAEPSKYDYFAPLPFASFSPSSLIYTLVSPSPL
jgi:hypothetical protein